MTWSLVMAVEQHRGNPPSCIICTTIPSPQVTTHSSSPRAKDGGKEWQSASKRSIYEVLLDRHCFVLSMYAPSLV